MPDNHFNNTFHIIGDGNTVHFSQSVETGGDTIGILRVVLGFVAMILLSPIWIPAVLLEAGRNQLSGGNDYE